MTKLKMNHYPSILWYLYNFTDKEDKLQSLGAAGISALVPFLPRILSSFLPQAIVSKVPVVMASLSAFEFILSVKDIVKDKSLTKSETF